MFIFAIIGYAFLAIYELIPLFKQKLWREFWTVAVLWLFSFTIVTLLCFHVKIPTPAKPIQELITSIFGK